MRTLSAAAKLMIVLGAPLASPALAQADFTGAGETLELDCNGGPAVITGASNVLTITGACSSLTITGASNRITVDLAKSPAIRIQGAGNEVAWRAPAGTKPHVSVAGAGNRISRQR